MDKIKEMIDRLFIGKYEKFRKFYEQPIYDNIKFAEGCSEERINKSIEYHEKRIKEELDRILSK